MRRFFASLLSTSAVLAATAPAFADAPARHLEYAVVAMNGGAARHATVHVDFVGGSAERLMIVNVAETDDTALSNAANVGILASGALRVEGTQALTSEEEAICAFMSLESEDLIAMGPGDHWERKGLTAGGRYLMRFAVTAVAPDGKMDFNVTRDLYRDNGSTVHWSGTLNYDQNAVVPAAITLGGDATLTIKLTRDTFVH
jgi:hypothetical protein